MIKELLAIAFYNEIVLILAFVLNLLNIFVLKKKLFTHKQVMQYL